MTAPTPGAGNRERAQEVVLQPGIGVMYGRAELTAAITAALDAAEARGRAEMAGKYRELAAEWDDESRQAMDRGDAARQREDRTMYAVNVRHARVIKHAALELRALADSAPADPGRGGEGGERG